MKKLLTLTLCTAISFCFLSCSKDENTLDQRLVGTKWQTRATAYEIVYGGTAYDVYEFTSETQVDNYTVKNGNVVDTDGTDTYNLNYPNLTIHHGESDYNFTFKDSRTIVRVGANEYSPYMKYIKQ